jgi:predicted phage terminase large subunit-like protein
MAMFGLRLGSQVKALFTTTPKPKPLVVSLIREAEAEASKPPGERRTIMIRGSTYENRANLAPNFFEDLVTRYEGTTLGRQELYAEVIDPEEQGIIKRSWIQLWPANKPLPALRFVVLSLDTAFTEATRDKKTGDRDPTAGTVWGVFEHPDQPGRDCLICLDAWDDYLDMPDLVKRAPAELQIEYGEKQQPVIRSIFGTPAIMAPGGRKPDVLIIEDKGSGISLRQMLARESIEAYAYNPGKASKLERLHAVAHLFANGIVYVPESRKLPGKPMTWAEDMIQQLCTFSGEGSVKHDDYVDSCTQAIRYLTDKHWVTLKPKPPRDPAVAAHRPAARVNPYKA